ncbi:MAG TPA: hypothetical protein VE959_15505 [Bryobacteraceae bacterium]|nr:hypothetical protein [Bryobacteraceae bacterium]
MTLTATLQDLIVLAADGSMQGALEEVLKRYHSLGIREISYKVIQQPNFDPGVLHSGHSLLQSQNKNYLHAVAVCDRHGCGKEALPREELETLIEKSLSNHWADRAAAIVIDPELENWLWADSPHVAKEIGWPGGKIELREWLRNEGFLTPGQSKPSDPKAALEKALRLTKRRQSSALYRTLASKVTLQQCADPAFLKLTETLRRWFSAAGAGS